MTDRTALLETTASNWELRKSKERETDTHPCDTWHPDRCLCKGSCSCHWADVPEERARTINALKQQVQAFYWACFTHNIGGRAHAFLEFCGIMTAYVQVLESAVRAGLDPQELNAHTGEPIPVQGHEIQYLAEKLNCIFGPVLSSNPEARKILLKELFNITE